MDQRGKAVVILTLDYKTEYISKCPSHLKEPKKISNDDDDDDDNILLWWRKWRERELRMKIRSFNQVRAIWGDELEVKQQSLNIHSLVDQFSAFHRTMVKNISFERNIDVNVSLEKTNWCYCCCCSE